MYIQLICKGGGKTVTNGVIRCNESGKSGGGRDFVTQPPDQRVKRPTGYMQ